MLKVTTENFKKVNFSLIFLFLSLFFIFFPIRHVFFSSDAYKTGAYSDFTSISLYICDLFIISGIRYFITPNKFVKYVNNLMVSILILISFLTLRALFGLGPYASLNIYFLLKFIEIAIVAYGTFYFLLSSQKNNIWFMRFFVFFGSIESILGISQFIKQSSIGLNKLGENIISPNIDGVAKIIVNGTKYIRAYGTFPHPNLLSAFLLTTIIFNLWLILKPNNQKWQLLLYLSLFLNIFGLALTFSRASFLALFGALFITFISIFWKKLWNRRVALILGFLTFSLVSAFLVLKPFLLTRATVEDQASLERIFYAKIGWQIVKTHPLFGVGLGESVLHMQQYSPIPLQPWQIQPVHNYFLLAATETGIVGVLLLIIIFMLHVKQLLQSLKYGKTGDMELKIILLGTFVGYLVLMQFDHYFYTLEQTQLLLWIILGMIGSQSTKEGL